jgi:hypothetical protein
VADHLVSVTNIVSIARRPLFFQGGQEMEEEIEGLIYSENLRMRGVHLTLWTLGFLFFTSASLTMLSLSNGLLKFLLSLSFFLPTFGFPTFKFWIARIKVEITTDGLYTRTNFPSVQRSRLFGWEQLTFCELKYWPKWGMLGDSKSGLFSKRWSFGRYVSRINSFNYAPGNYNYFKPIFGEKEVCFTVKENGETRTIVLDTNNPFDFVQAIERTMLVFNDKPFSVMIEKKTSFWERFSTQIIICCLMLIFVIVVIVWCNL